MKLVLLVLILVVIALVIVTLLQNKKEGNFSLKRSFLNEKEVSIYEELVSKLSPDFRVFPKVRMLDVVFTTKRNDFSSLGRISSKGIDFLITNKDFKPVAVLSRDEKVRNICKDLGLVVARTKPELLKLIMEYSKK
ncbi:DUF2726 domain-containing protein [Desulfurobacterium crinifex]